MLWIEWSLEFRLGNLIATVIFDFDAIPVRFGGREGGAAEDPFNSVSKGHFESVLSLDMVERNDR